MDIDILIIVTKKKGSGTETLDRIFHYWRGVQKQKSPKAGVES